MVYLWIKDGKVYNFAAETAGEAKKQAKALAGLNADPDMEISDEEFESAGCQARIIDREIYLGKTEAETAAANAVVEIESIKSAIAARDYRALKAQKLGEDIDTLYPGETDWYRAQIARIHELEAIAGVSA